MAKLTADERQEIRLRPAELDQDDWLDRGMLTDAEKALIEERCREMESNTKGAIPWARIVF